ncbi:hypothetical protein FNH22_31605 [Fulvivirga sp. M361]|uniref:IS66 family insertion sequence element accessory protein TnpA n=1 Tax=Fulvivirga sp. M361 TaxID=2594266 RepID=UPI00117B30E1|nr:hypothetical protein [Fulvivirga sp. M361]TRX45275.1 hypothetical protein FNH22_31605 [Fulvivirga sp. M361]
MKRHDASKMQEHYEEWLLSGKSKKEFALEKGISLSVFYYWIKKLEKNVPGVPPGHGFQRIGLQETAQPPVAIAVVRYPSGVSIEWHGPLEVHFLKALVE